MSVCELWVCVSCECVWVVSVCELCECVWVVWVVSVCELWGCVSCGLWGRGIWGSERCAIFVELTMCFLTETASPNQALCNSACALDIVRPSWSTEPIYGSSSQLLYVQTSSEKLAWHMLIEYQFVFRLISTSFDNLPDLSIAKLLV